ncbi:SdpI family protein [uncultured Sphingomonas sp.]|uniref:SdpI family protein n=1 Tax=uncultured Sphingomonas sp. TaxID=158754 RepID=UPI0035CBE08A
MSYRGMRIASVVVVAGMAAVAAAALQRLPSGAQLPVHWDLAGNVDRTEDAAYALFLPVGLTALVGGLMAALPVLEPMQRQLAQSAPLYRTAWAAVLAVLALTEVAIAAPAFGLARPTMLPLAGAGLALVAIGNMLPKSRPGFFVGIRTPWTLTDPENWIATHRLGARTMMAAGVLTMAAAVAPATMRAPLVVGAVALCLAPVPYSWWRWRRSARA